jgi:electron transfer flavoprotein alpha subunit
LTLARKVATAEGAELKWLVLGAMPERALEVAGTYGVSAVQRIDDAKLATFGPDAYVEALAQYCTQESPRALLFNQTFDARLVAPRLAARAAAGVVMNVVDVNTPEVDANSALLLEVPVPDSWPVGQNDPLRIIVDSEDDVDNELKENNNEADGRCFLPG